MMSYVAEVPVDEHRAIVEPMSDSQRLLELALKGLESERSKIDQEISDLTSRIKQQQSGKTGTDHKPPATTAGKLASRKARSTVQPQKTGRLTAAGRKRLSDAAKRRWAANRKTGKTTL
jgi:hypothetical protein